MPVQHVSLTYDGGWKHLIDIRYSVVYMNFILLLILITLWVRR